MRRGSGPSRGGEEGGGQGACHIDKPQVIVRQRDITRHVISPISARRAVSGSHLPIAIISVGFDCQDAAPVVPKPCLSYEASHLLRRVGAVAGFGLAIPESGWHAICALRLDLLPVVCRPAVVLAPGVSWTGPGRLPVSAAR